MVVDRDIELQLHPPPPSVGERSTFGQLPEGGVVADPLGTTSAVAISKHERHHHGAIKLWNRKMDRVMVDLLRALPCY